MNPKTSKMVCTATVCKALRRANCVSKKVRRTPKLTKTHKKKRVAFTDEHADEDWSAWLYSDEKLFETDGVQGNERMWVEADSPEPPELFVGKVAHPPKVMVWGCISYNGRTGLHFHDEFVDGSEYCKMLKGCSSPCPLHR